VVILTDYKGLDVTTISELRRKLRESNTEFKVVKNTLLIRASEDTGISLIKESFTGPSAIAINYDDPVAPAKILTEFAKTNKALEIKVGVMNGKVIDLNSINSLSTLPSREVLLSQVLAGMAGVTTGFVRALNDVPVRLLNVIQAIKEKKEAA
jgi:large subunit ribosomal protein L10